ncbi:hypothetical protein WMC37_04200 [Leuconostoc mesenteroides subsp. mesenteroides]
MLQIVGLFIWKNYAIFLTTIIFMNLISNFISSLYAENRYPWLRERQKIKFSFETDIRPILKTTFSAIIYKISGIFLNSTDNIIISIVISTTVVGMYTNYLLISNALILLVTVIFSAYTPSIGKILASKDEKHDLEKTFYDLQEKSGIVSIFVVTLFAVGANYFIKIWMGSAFVMNTFTVLMLSVNLYLATGFQPIWVFREAAALYKILQWRMLWAAIINIPISILLAKLFGVGGVVLGSVIARLLTYYLYEPIVISTQIIHSKISKYFITLLVNFTVTLAISIIAQYVGGIILANLSPVYQLFISWGTTFVIDCIVICFIYGNPISKFVGKN